MKQQIRWEVFAVTALQSPYTIFDSDSPGKYLDCHADFHFSKLSLHSGASQMSDSDSNTIRTKGYKLDGYTLKRDYILCRMTLSEMITM